MEEMAAAVKVKELELNSYDGIQALQNMVAVGGWVAYENTEVCKHTVA